MSKDKSANRTRMIGLALSTALASATLAGCSAKVAPQASHSSGEAQVALKKGKATKAIKHAEAAVLAAPRTAENRALLASAYMEAGRFSSAAATFGEAVELGDTAPRTIISYALAQMAAGQSSAALKTLDTYEADLDPADFGLAVAMAGRPQQGIHVLGNALRSGQNTAKVRQNLAYAFALKGDWRSARLMVAQDLPAHKVDERLGSWAVTSANGYHQARVASLLGVPIVTDPGQPVELALRNHPSVPMLATENKQAPKVAAATPVVTPASATSGELPAVSDWTSAVDNKPAKKPAPVKMAAAKPVVQPVAKPAKKPAAKPAAPRVAKAVVQKPAAKPAAKPAVKTASAKPATIKKVNGVSYASREVVQKIPHTQRVAKAASVKKPSAKPVAKPAPKMASADGGYRVQLGSYFSMSDAQAAWKVFLARHPELKDAQKVISKAKVKGKIYYRVAAGGFAKASAVSMCSQVKRGGAGCIAYAANNPLPGTIDNNVRVAAR